MSTTHDDQTQVLTPAPGRPRKKTIKVVTAP